MKHLYPVSTSLREEVERKIESLHAHTREHFKADVPKFAIKYDLYGLRILGMANYTLQIMRLHSPLLLEYRDIYINDVVVHEFAHFVVAHLYPDGRNSDGKKVTGHGKEFKHVCGVFGIEGKTTTALYCDSKSLLDIHRSQEQKRKQETTAIAREELLEEFDIEIVWRQHIDIIFTTVQKTMLLYQLRQILGIIQSQGRCTYYYNEPCYEEDLIDLMDKIQHDDMIDMKYGDVVVTELSNMGRTLHELEDRINTYAMLEAIQKIQMTQE